MRLTKKSGVAEPARRGEAQDGLGPLADEGKPERGGVGFPHDGVEALDQVAKTLLGRPPRRLQALLLAEILDDQEQPGRLVARHADPGHRDEHRARLATRGQVQVEEEVVLRTARLQHLAGAADQRLGAGDVGEGSANDVLLAEPERLEEGRVDRENHEVGREQEQPGGHAGDDLLGIAAQIGDGALLLHLRSQQLGALPLPPDADQQSGEREEKESPRGFREPLRRD